MVPIVRCTSLPIPTECLIPTIVIKIMVGGGVASETDAIETVQYTAEEIRAITTTCKQMGGKLCK